jgi:hypothetical protein
MNGVTPVSKHASTNWKRSWPKPRHQRPLNRADFERERERCERLTLELIRAAVETMNAKEAAARLEGELAARRSRPWWKWLAGGANWLRRREFHVPSAA